MDRFGCELRDGIFVFLLFVQLIVIIAAAEAELLGNAVRVIGAGGTDQAFAIEGLHHSFADHRVDVAGEDAEVIAVDLGIGQKTFISLDGEGSEVADNDLDKAEEYLGKAAGTKANLNAALGTLYTKKGDYAAAKKAYGETATNNAAVQQILDEDYAAAAKTLANVKEPNATTAYLKAVVGARTNDKAAVIENLKAAVAQDAKLKVRAAQDIEFAKFAEDAEFQAIVK